MRRPQRIANVSWAAPCETNPSDAVAISKTALDLIMILYLRVRVRRATLVLWVVIAVIHLIHLCALGGLCGDIFPCEGHAVVGSARAA